MVNLTLNELRRIAKMRHIRGYKRISREQLLSALDEYERNFINVRIKKIRKDLKELRDIFSKPKIK